jgi:predicted signal transduction protein with EAL and GGDEF domain
LIGSLKFQTRLTLVYLALFMAVQSIIIITFYTTTYRNIDDQVRNQLSSSAKTFTAIIQSRVTDLAGRAKDQAGQFEFRDAIATADGPTIRSALRNFSSRIEADLGIVYGLDGKATALVGGNGLNIDSVPDLPEDMQEVAEAAGKATRIIEIGGHIYELVAVPVLSPLPTAMLVYGIELDQVEALNIKRISSIDLEIAFLYRNEGVFEVASSTSGQSALNSFLRTNMTAEQGAVFRTKYRGDDYMFWRMGLEGASETQGEIAALLYYSIDKALTPYINLAITLSAVIFVGILMLVIGSMLLSRGVTRPLRRLAGATHRIAEGDYHEVEAASKGDEIADLTNSFNLMVDAVKERESEIVFQAQHDSETGLPNRNHFDKELSQAIGSNNEFCLVFAEIQQLSDLRSVLNHSHVNDLLSGVGERISQVANVKVSRISTETFAFIMTDMDNADVVASLIINAFMTPFELADIVVDASLKMGISKFPTDNKEASKLTQYANAALDQGRQNPKSFAWYVADTSKSYKQHLSLMSDLRDALDSGEVFFAYQPKLDLASGKIASAEALVRWISPSRGFVPPDEFIPFAEKTGDVRHLTEWGLKTAVKQCADWRARGIDIAVAVNLSTSDLMNANLPGQVLKLLRDHKLPPSYLKLEVTESAVMHDMTRALEVLNMLNAMGLPLSIDDYGTGYSSLSYLKRLPVNELKIDMSFVRNLANSEEDRILVRSTIELGHNLGLSITAEGVEDQASVDLLSEYGCDTLQGYFISKPVPAADFEAFLKDTRYK